MTKSGYIVAFCALFLSVLGLIMVFNASAAEILDKKLVENSYTALSKQCLYFFLGTSLASLFSLLGYKRIFSLASPLYFICILGLFAAFIPGIGHAYNGARRWIGLFGFTFQPSEFMKYILPMYFAKRIYALETMSFTNLFPIFLALCLPLFLILLEPDNGTTFIIGFTLLVSCLLLRIPSMYWALPLFFLALVGLAIGSQMPHVPGRIRIYLNPELDLKGKGHQPYQAKIAAGSGGLWGRGLGESLQKYNYLPEAKSDYIAAIFAEELGFLGIFFLILLYVCLSAAGFSIAFSSQEKIGFFMASIFSFLLAFQAFLNLGIVSNLLPSKGTTLPFISQGGSSMIANICAVFLLINISQAKKRRLCASLSQ